MNELQCLARVTGALLAVASSACGGLSPRSPDAPVAISDGLAATFETQAASMDTAACTSEATSQANGGHLHTAQDCDPVTYATNPPSSGTHYPDWAAYKTYATPVPWGFLVHDLEHGAIVVVYNCPDGCADEVARAQAVIDGLAPDPACGGQAKRIVLAPDPALDTRWAASAWTWTWRAPCLDGQALAAFIAAHYGGPDTERACGGGVDRSVAGWCP